MNEYVNKIIELYTKVRLGKAAREVFHNWLTDEELFDEKEAALLKLWNQTNSNATKDTLDALAAVKSKSRQNIEKSNKRLILWRYAAAIILMICITSAYIFTINSNPDIKLLENFTQAGELDTIILPDGSIVQTNSRTILFYSESFGKDNRTLYISGEANLKVQKNQKIPFIIKSKDFAVTAVGTEFDVSSYSDDPLFKVTLIEGCVKVQQEENDDDYTLRARDQFVYNKQTQEYNIAKVDLYEATAWQRGELIFRRTTIHEIFNALERKYGVSFQYKSNTFNDDKYNFKFNKESNLTDIIDIIKGVVGDFEYKKSGDSIYINP